MARLDQHSHPAPRVRRSITRLLLACALLAAAAPVLAQRALLSHAEQPAKLIRKTTVLTARAGVSLQPGDIVESGAAGLQIEWANGALMALGPGSSVQLGAVAGAPAVDLLRGWIKIAASRAATTQLTATVGVLDVRVASGSGILHLAPGQAELFVELGTLTVLARDRPGAAVPVNREQYGLRSGALALQLAARPPRAFIAAMPRTFYDPLVAVALRVQPAAAAAQREAGARDLADWGAVSAAVNKRLVAQFAGRLADPAFARDAEIVLGSNPDWRLALNRRALAIKRGKAVSNLLF